MLLFKGCTGKRSRLCLRGAFNFNLQWGIDTSFGVRRPIPHSGTFACVAALS